MNGSKSCALLSLMACLSVTTPLLAGPTSVDLSHDEANQLKQLEQSAPALKNPKKRQRSDANHATKTKPFTIWGEQVALNQPWFKAYVQFFSNEGKATLSVWMRRMAMYETIIRKELKAQGVPPDLLYVVMIESGFISSAQSHKKAVGFWQFLDATAKENGLKINAHVDERQDYIKSTQGAARYLKKLHSKFGTWALALAAFNGGPNRVERIIKKYNTNDFWQLQAQGAFPSETTRYVPKIMAAAYMIQHPKQFGLDGVVMGKALNPSFVTVHKPVLLAHVAKMCKTNLVMMRMLNPELLKYATPPQRAGYTLRIPSSCVSNFVKRVDGITLDNKAKVSMHTVAFGERLEDVARHYRVAPHVLRSINGLEKDTYLKEGTKLTIVTKTRGQWRAPSRSIKATVPNLAFQYPNRQQRFYRVRQGDTLKQISVGLNLAFGDLVMWNDLDPRAHLLDGMILQVFTKSKNSLALIEPKHVQVIRRKKTRAHLTPVAIPTANSRVHKIQNGDSLWSIAKQYGTTVETIKRLNPQIKGLEHLQIGQKIYIQANK